MTPGCPDDPEFRAALMGYAEWGTRLAVQNSQPGAEVVEHAPVPRWGWGVAPAVHPLVASKGRMRPSLLAAVACLLLPFVVIAVALAARRARGGAAAGPAPTPTATPTAAPSATPVPDLPIAGPGLAVGVTEFNPTSSPAPPRASCRRRGPACATRWARSGPAYFRLVIDWSAIQPSADEPADLEVAPDRLQPGREAVPGVVRRARPAAGARLAPARGRLAGARRDHVDAGVGGGAAPAAASGRARRRAPGRRASMRCPPTAS